MADSPATLLVPLLLVLLGAWWVGRHTTKNIIPVDVDDTWRPIRDFYRARPGDVSGDVELGGRWSSERDPGAAFTLTWLPETGEVVAFRRQAKATVGYGPGAVFIGGSGFARMNRKAEGMKTLAVSDLDTVERARPGALRGLPDGLDQLSTILGQPYVPPSGADEFAAALAGGTRPRLIYRERLTDDAERADRRDRRINALPVLLSIVLAGVIAAVLIGNALASGNSLVPTLFAVGVGIAVVIYGTTTAQALRGNALVRRLHRDHHEARRQRHDV